MRTLVIGSGYAGAGRGAARLALLRDELQVEVRLAHGPGEAQALAQAASGFDCVVAAGGDGTVHEVANGLLRAAQPALLGILPLGTGNDIARNLGLLTPDDGLAALRRGAARPLDVFQIDCRDADNRPQRLYGLLNCGIGFGAEVVRHTTTRVKRLIGSAGAYYAGVLGAMLAWDQPWLRLDHDGGTWRGRAFYVALGNGEWEGAGMMRLSPGALLDDGVAHLTIIRSAAKPYILQRLPLLASGAHVHNPKVLYLPTRSLHVLASQPLGLQSDGDVVGQTPARITLLAGALRVLAPKPGDN